MKKFHIIQLVSAILCSFGFLQSPAQINVNREQEYSPDQPLFLTKTYPATTTFASQKAIRNFNKDYCHAVGAEWSTLSGEAFMCRFSINSIPYRAFYTIQGHLICAISTYSVSNLDKKVYDRVRCAYYNSEIISVNQIDRNDGKTVYVVEIQDEKSIRKLRVDDETIEVMEELERH